MCGPPSPTWTGCGWPGWVWPWPRRVRRWPAARRRSDTCSPPAARVRWPTLFGLVLASTGLARMMRARAAGGGWGAACFGRAGLGAPGGGWVFACAAGGRAARLAPLPGGLGGGEGGMLGALPLPGPPPAAAAAAVIVYRVAGYWAVGA